MAPNVLAALGQAAPGITEEWRNIVKQQREEELFPMQKEAMSTSLAMSKETLEKTRMETKKQKDIQQRMEAPANAKEWLKQLNLRPESEQMAMAHMSLFQVDPKTGYGRAGDVLKGFDALVQSKEWHRMVSGEAEYWSGMYEEAAKKYQDAKIGQDPEKQQKLLDQMNQYKSNATRMGGISSKTNEFIRKRDEMTGTIQDIQQSGEWDKFDPQERAALLAAAKSGSEINWQHAMDRIQTRIGKTTTKGQDFKTSKGYPGESTTGWVHENLVTGERKPGAPPPREPVGAKPEKWVKPDGTIGWVTPGQEPPKGWTPYEKSERGLTKPAIDKLYAQYNISRVKAKNDPLRAAMARIFEKEGVAVSAEEEWPKLTRGQFEKYITTGELQAGEKTPAGAPSTVGLPPAEKHKGRTVRDTTTGKRYESDGKTWKEIR